MAIVAWNDKIKEWTQGKLGSAGGTSFSVKPVARSSFRVGNLLPTSFKAGAASSSVSGLDGKLNKLNVVKVTSNKPTTVKACGVGQKLVNGKCVGVSVSKTVSAVKKTCPTGYMLVNGVCTRTVTKIAPKAVAVKSASSSKKSSSSRGKYVYSSGTGTVVSGSAKEVAKYGGSKGTFAKR